MKIDKKFQEFPKTTRLIEKGDIWLAYYPYREKGNMEKLRPVYVSEVNEDNIKVYMITTNKNRGIPLKVNLSNRKEKRQSYLNFNNYSIIKKEKFYIKIKSKYRGDEIKWIL